MRFSTLLASIFSAASLASSLVLNGGTFGKDGYTADYIIVGIGTAGAVVAGELTNNPNISVIGIHNGPNLTNDPLIKYSANAAITVPLGLFGPPLYQTGSTTPQPNADNRELTWTIALPEGGASSINAGAYVRGTNEVYAQWEAIAGPNWSVNRILNVFKGLEHFYGLTSDPGDRGYHGPVSVLQVQEPSEVSLKFTEAVTAATGFAPVIDYNDPNTPIGPAPRVQYTQSGQDGIYRVSSATAFLNQMVMAPFGLGVHGRKLRIFFDSTALRVLWEGNKAVGIEFFNGNEVKQAYAKKGVIVCAGLRSSPFLMLSGVGPKALLDSLKIPVIFDNPNVGQGLADQPGIRTIFSADPFDTSLLDDTVMGLFDQLTHLPSPSGDPSVREFRLGVANPVPGVVLATFDLVQPKSRGTVSIGSSDPFADPIVNLGVLSNPDDLALYLQGFQVYITAINTALHNIDSDYEIVSPDIITLSDPLLLTEFIREEVSCNEHFQSHCRMAPLNQGGVVDSFGRVYGVQNLYVADNSIVPMCMDGAPMASAYLIGANIAQLILENTSKPKFVFPTH